MCFDDRDTYTTRTYVANGARYSEHYLQPRYGMSWRRRNGLGGRYYPSRYYSRRPSGRYMSSALTTQNRYSNYGGYPQRHGYPSYGYAQQTTFPRGVVSGGYMRYPSGYGRYYPESRVATPHHTDLVRLPCFLLSPIVLPSGLPFYTPPPSHHWLESQFDSFSDI
jgi:hypothetical protein